MLLLSQKRMPNRRKKMNLDNRRLTEIQREKKLFHSLLNKSESISECLTYKEKLDLLEKEEKEILARNDVII